MHPLSLGARMSSEIKEIGDLVAALTAKTKEMAATEHVGHFNRLFQQREQIYAAIEALPEGAAALSLLLEDSDPQVQLAVARHCKFKKINLDAALNTLRRLAERRDKIGSEAQSSLDFHLPEPSNPAPQFVPPVFSFLPTPPGCDKTKAEALVGAALHSEQAQEINKFLRPSIRIWPKKSAGSPIGSRFGGLPAVPPDWTWPFAQEEPFVFLAQINCAELGELAKFHNLPDHGLLSFFGDHDEINGIPSNGGAVFYFEDVSGLAVAALPMEEDEPLLTCDMDFYETYELPHPFSNVIEALGFDKEHRDSYFDLYAALAQFGFDENKHLDGNDISKLLGWPDLVQGEVEDLHSGLTRLLLQVGQYRDGTELCGWGSGGLLYFLIRPDDLATGAFDFAELTVQCT
jgi:uncharacterized protein YwqG